jgi:hypothetical protein
MIDVNIPTVNPLAGLIGDSEECTVSIFMVEGSPLLSQNILVVFFIVPAVRTSNFTSGDNTSSESLTTTSFIDMNVVGFRKSIR